MINEYWAIKLIKIYRRKLVFFPNSFSLGKNGIFVTFIIGGISLFLALVGIVIIAYFHISDAKLGEFLSWLNLFFVFLTIWMSIFMVAYQITVWYMVRGTGKKVDRIELEYRMKFVHKFMDECEIKNRNEFRKTVKQVDEMNFNNFFWRIFYEVKFAKLLVVSILGIMIGFLLNALAQNAGASAAMLEVIGRIFGTSILFFIFSFSLTSIGNKFPISSNQIKRELDSILSRLELYSEVGECHFTKGYLIATDNYLNVNEKLDGVESAAHSELKRCFKKSIIEGNHDENLEKIIEMDNWREKLKELR